MKASALLRLIVTKMVKTHPSVTNPNLLFSSLPLLEKVFAENQVSRRSVHPVQNRNILIQRGLSKLIWTSTKRLHRTTEKEKESEWSSVLAELSLEQQTHEGHKHTGRFWVASPCEPLRWFWPAGYSAGNKGMFLLLLSRARMESRLLLLLIPPHQQGDWGCTRGWEETQLGQQTPVDTRDIPYHVVSHSPHRAGGNRGRGGAVVFDFPSHCDTW